MNNSSPPPAPDPVATANAATTSNANTALATQQLAATNQIGPDGSLTYTHTPSDISSGGVNIPQYTATTTLSPENQAIHNTDLVTKQNIANIGKDQSARVGGILNTPVDLSPGAVDAHLTDLGMQRLQPQLDRDWQARETALMNRGIMPGSENYRQEQDAANRQRNDAYDQLILNGYGQGQQSILAARNQPINEITALLSGSQVSQPNFLNTPQTNVAPVDVGSIYNQGYANQLGAWNAGQSQTNAMIGGLAGLGGAALGGWGMGGFRMPSDRRVKKDIRRVGTLDNGLPVYSFNYKSGGPTQIGLMADEVEKLHPTAVESINGIKHVDYGMAVN